MIVTLAGCSTQTQDTPVLTPTEQRDDSVSTQRLFVLGDSLTAGYQLAYEDSYPAQVETMLQDAGYDILVINGGESGDTSEWLQTRIDRITANAQPGDIALIVIGGNDGLRGLSIQEMEQNILDIITQLQEREIVTIIGWMQIPTNLGKAYRTAFAEVYPRVAEETESVLIPFILSGVAGIPELNLPDGIHPNTTGQTIIAQTVVETILSHEPAIIQTSEAPTP